jgi:hypothetical protein
MVAAPPARIIPNRGPSSHVACKRALPPNHSRDVVGAVVDTVNTTVAAPPPAAIWVGENEQLLSAGKFEQEYITALENVAAPAGAKFNVYEAELPALTVWLPEALLN